MTEISFTNQYGQIDIALIKDEQIAALDEPRKVAIHNVISTVMRRIEAEQALVAARKRVEMAMAIEFETEARMRALSPPPTEQEAWEASVNSYRQQK